MTELPTERHTPKYIGQDMAAFLNAVHAQREEKLRVFAEELTED